VRFFSVPPLEEALLTLTTEYRTHSSSVNVPNKTVLTSCGFLGFDIRDSDEYYPGLEFFIFPRNEKLVVSIKKTELSLGSISVTIVRIPRVFE